MFILLYVITKLKKGSQSVYDNILNNIKGKFILASNFGNSYS